MVKMVNFIKQEAKDKAGEILARGNEEYSIEKANLVQSEKLKINAAHERRLKTVDTQKRIAYSNRLNQARLKVLQAREQTVDALFAEARQRLSQVTANKDKYKALLENLILQVRVPPFPPPVTAQLLIPCLAVMHTYRASFS
jgi:V-type H+-transporting ATPase subunit E